jgi:hypothetical protein
MHCSFRYLDKNCDASVNLHLFRTNNGTVRADVKGPVTRHLDGHSDISELSICLSREDAFPTAIRMANRNDAELVVTGDPSLWSAEWGTLRFATDSASKALTA